MFVIFLKMRSSVRWACKCTCVWARFAIMPFHALIILCSFGRLKWHLWVLVRVDSVVVWIFLLKITRFSILNGIFVWETIIQNIQRNPIRTTRSTLLFFISFFFWSLFYCMYEMESTMTIVCGFDVIFLLVMYCLISVGLYRDSSIMFSLLFFLFRIERSMTCSSFLLSHFWAAQHYYSHSFFGRFFFTQKIIVFCDEFVHLWQ